jgi:hypothetical protein
VSDSAADVAEFVAREIAYATFAYKEDDCAYNGDGTSAFDGIAGLGTKLAVRMKNKEPCRRGPRQKSSTI